MSIGGNKQHFSANDVKHYCKFKDITTLGVFNYDGMSYFGNGERQYIKDVVKELEAMLKSNIKELRNVDCTIDDKRRIFIRLDFEDNVGFENWPNCKSVSDNPDYHTNNIYTSFVYLPETRTLARFRQGALDTPENF